MVRRGHTRNSKMYHQWQNDQSPKIARFFKIVFGKDCSKLLYLPPQFAPKVKGLINKQFQIEDSCGQQWSMTLDEDVDGTLIFKKGWNKFFLDHNLEEGEVLVFNYMSENHFLVQIFGLSACEREEFNSGRPQQNKRSRRGPETDSQSEAFRRTDTNLRDVPSSDFSVASGREFLNSQCEPSSNFEDLLLPKSIGMEDANCVINRDDEHKGQDTNILYDLSIFEMGNLTNHVNNFEEGVTEISHSHPEVIEYTDNFDKAIDTKVAPSHIHSAEQSKTKGNGAQMLELHKDLVDGYFSTDIDTNSTPSRNEIAEQRKIMGHDSEIAVDLTDEISGSSGEIFVTKFEKVSDSKTSPCAEVTGKTKNCEGAEKAVIRTDSFSGHSGGISDSFRTKASDHSHLRKDMSDNVLKFQHGCGKIAEREKTVKGRCLNSSISSSVLKNLVETGKHSIKKELAELKQETDGFPMPSFGKEPNTAMKHSQVLPPVVKIESDQSSDIIPLAPFSPFSAEVKSLSYLELPVRIPSVRGRRERGPAKVVYVKDSRGRPWPIFYCDPYPMVALTGNWREFCERNDIKIGDKCRIQAEHDMLCICRVDGD